MLKNPIVKNILSALAVTVVGFLLLNLAFLFDFLFQSLITGIISIFTPVDFEKNFQWLPPFMHGLFIIIIGVISWFVFKSKLKKIFKAIFMPVPLAAVLVTLGILFYQWLAVPFLLGGLFIFGVLYYFYKTKQPWIYYYALVLISLTLAIVGLLGVEIEKQ